MAGAKESVRDVYLTERSADAELLLEKRSRAAGSTRCRRSARSGGPFAAGAPRSSTATAPAPPASRCQDPEHSRVCVRAASWRAHDFAGNSRFLARSRRTRTIAMRCRYA